MAFNILQWPLPDILNLLPSCLFFSNKSTLNPRSPARPAAIIPDANNPYGRPCRAAELMKLVESLGYTMYYHFPRLTNKAKEGELAYGVVSFNMLCVHQYKGYEFAKLEQASWHLSPVVKNADGQYVVNQQ